MGQCCCSWLDELCGDAINADAVDLSHFTLHRVLGKGGFGKVSVAESRVNGQFYAIKSMNKRWLLQSESNCKSVWLERHILAQVRSPFIVHTYHAFQDASKIYLVMNFLSGGDMHYLLHQSTLNPARTSKADNSPRPLKEKHVKFYMAELLLGLEELHAMGLIYRVEPEGLTVGSCGTHGYQAPELLNNERYDTTPDIYAFGVVMYELLHGYLPANQGDPSLLHYSAALTPNCIDLLTRLLQPNPSDRIGCTPSSAPYAQRLDSIKSHAFFKEYDWVVVRKRQLEPPLRPNSRVANCDPMFEMEEQLVESELLSEAGADSVPLSKEQQAVWSGWDWHTDVGYHTKDGSILSLLPSSSSSSNMLNPTEGHPSATSSATNSPVNAGLTQAASSLQEQFVLLSQEQRTKKKVEMSTHVNTNNNNNKQQQQQQQPILTPMSILPSSPSQQQAQPQAALSPLSHPRTQFLNASVRSHSPTPSSLHHPNRTAHRAIHAAAAIAAANATATTVEGTTAPRTNVESAPCIPLSVYRRNHSKLAMPQPHTLESYATASSTPSGNSTNAEHELMFPVISAPLTSYPPLIEIGQTPPPIESIPSPSMKRDPHMISKEVEEEEREVDLTDRKQVDINEVAVEVEKEGETN